MIKDVISGKGGWLYHRASWSTRDGKNVDRGGSCRGTRETANDGICWTNWEAMPVNWKSKLTEILELAALWDAVLLLDEADVFLEARSLHELQRNAMVGVFLRLLEYHQRVMFLTTNRITTIDEAFKSRISVAIKYQDLEESARRKIWENFLVLAGVKIVDGVTCEDDGSYVTKEQVNKLASKRLNGREIKNITRTAQALSVSSKQPLRYDLIMQVLEIVEQFDVDFNSRGQ